MTPTPEDRALAMKIADELVNYSNLTPEQVRRRWDTASELIAAHTAPLRELAEIGRLAVEEKKQAIRDPVKWSDLEAAMDALDAASGAYLRKQQSKP